MSVLAALGAPARAGWRALSANLGALDRGLVWFANPFGANVRSPVRRYGTLLGLYAAIYVLATALGAWRVPLLPLALLGVGYVGVLAVGRAWVKNEKQRAAVAKRLVDGDPDALPDLRGTALVSALQLVLLFPLIFWQAHANFPDLFDVPEGATFGTWVLFTVDCYNKVLLGLLNLYGVHLETVEPASNWGRHLVLIGRLTIEWLLIQGVVRLLAIRETVRDAVAAVIRDPSLAVYVGRRTVGPLIGKLGGADAEVRRRAAEVLGRLHDERAVEPLVEALRRDADEGVRGEAARALGLLKAVPAVRALIEALDDLSEEVRPLAAEALGRVGDARAVRPLLGALDGESAGARAAAARALAELGAEGAPDYLMQMAVEDPDEEVRAAALAALKGRWLDRAVLGLVEVLSSAQEKVGWWGKLFGAGRSRQESDQAVNDRQRAAEALGELADARAVEALIAALELPDRLVRRAAVVSLGKIGGPAVVEPLVRALQDKERDVRGQAALALGAVGDARAVEPLLQAWRQDREGEVRLAAAQAVQRVGPELARRAGVRT
jgi:HEAT repeat protein